MNFTAKETMYHGNRGLIQAGESIDFSEEEIKEFEPDYFKQLFSGNEDEVAKIFNPKSKAKDKEPPTETQPPETEPGDKNPSTEIEPVSENETEPSEPEQVDESSDTETVDEVAEETVEETVEEKPAAKGSGRGKKKTDTTEE